MNSLVSHDPQIKQGIETNKKGKNTQCPFCSVQCTMNLVKQETTGGIIYKVVPKNNPTSEGRLCVKGLNAHQHALNPARIHYPMLRKNGEFVQISWQRAMEFLQDKFTDIQHQNGTNAVGVYGGGSLTNEAAYLLGKFARVGLQTKHIDYNGRFCMSAAATAGNEAFGIDRGFTNKLSEIPLARCIILAGTNIAECQPTLMPYLTEAKENGSFIVVIDPRETPTTEIADLHLKVKPGMDAALVNGFLKVIFENGFVDEEFLQSRTSGFNDLKEHINEINLKEIARMTGIEVESIRLAATQYATSTTGMVFTARGVEQQTDGYMAVRNLLNLVLVTGKIGKPGSGYGAITGQGNGQGGREHGQKADQLPGYRHIENDMHRRYISRIWGIDEADLPRKGVSAYEMMERVDAGEIKALFVMGSNPIVSNPNANFVERSLKKLNCLVVVDLFISETARLADLILPCASYLENEGTMTNLEGRVTLREAVRESPGEAKQDWKILCEIAQSLGKGKFFSFSSSEAIFNELRIASRGGIADYFGITYERLKQDRIYWPCPKQDHPGESRLFGKTFAHSDGKAKLITVSNHYPKERTDKEFPLYLTTGRVISHYLTGVQTRNSPALKSSNFESFLEIHPRTAKQFKIQNHTLVKLASKRGYITVRSKFTKKIREDTVFVPFHWGDDQSVNRITSEALDPTCKMPGFKVCAVNISPMVDLSLN